MLLRQQPACAAGLQQYRSLTPSARRHRHHCILTAFMGGHGQVEYAMLCTLSLLQATRLHACLNCSNLYCISDGTTKNW